VLLRDLLYSPLSLLKQQPSQFRGFYQGAARLGLRRELDALCGDLDPIWALRCCAAELMRGDPQQLREGASDAEHQAYINGLLDGTSTGGRVALAVRRTRMSCSSRCAPLVA
jgi:hypothetical protein